MKEVDSGQSDYVHEFDDKYKIQFSATERVNTFQFITPDGKFAKKLSSRDDPRELSMQTAIGKEMKKHIVDPNRKTDTIVDEEFECLIIKLSEWAEEIIVNKNEAHSMAGELQEQIKQEQIEEGHSSLEETEYPLVWVGNVVDWLTAGERINILYAWISYCSQVILENPISVIAIGDGGSGKTHIVETALQLLPQEYVMNIKSTTEAALFGFCDEDPYQFDHKVVNIGDMGGKDDHQEAQDFKNAMKELQSDGYMMRIKQVRDPDGEGHINKKYELYGHPCLTYTNVPGFEYEDQEMSRSIMLTPRTDNDKAVGRFKKLNRSSRNRTAILIQSYKDRIPYIQNMVLALRDRMNDVEIENPYGYFMEKYLMNTKYYKRDVDKYDGILRVITALNGYNRPLFVDEHGNKVLFTTKNDIKYFLDLLTRYHESITANISPGASDILKELRENDGNWGLYDEGITVNEYMHKSVMCEASKASVQSFFYEMNRANKLKVIGKEAQSNIYALTEVTLHHFEKEIKLDVEDIKELKFNYGIDNIDEYENHGEYKAPDTIWEDAERPHWNKFLPEENEENEDNRDI